jgi:hypothetical protein
VVEKNGAHIKPLRRVESWSWGSGLVGGRGSARAGGHWTGWSRGADNEMREMKKRKKKKKKQ